MLVMPACLCSRSNIISSLGSKCCGEKILLNVSYQNAAHLYDGLGKRPSSSSVVQNKVQIQFNVAGSIAAQAQRTPHGHVIQETEQSNDSKLHHVLFGRTIPC